MQLLDELTKLRREPAVFLPKVPDEHAQDDEIPRQKRCRGDDRRDDSASRSQTLVLTVGIGDGNGED